MQRARGVIEAPCVGAPMQYRAGRSGGGLRIAHRPRFEAFAECVAECEDPAAGEGNIACVVRLRHRRSRSAGECEFELRECVGRSRIRSDHDRFNWSRENRPRVLRFKCSTRDECSERLLRWPTQQQVCCGADSAVGLRQRQRSHECNSRRSSCDSEGAKGLYTRRFTAAQRAAPHST